MKTPAILILRARVVVSVTLAALAQPGLSGSASGSTTPAFRLAVRTHSGSVELLRSDPQNRITLQLPADIKPGAAELSPRGDLIAISVPNGFATDRYPYVAVVDTFGAVATRFRGGERFAWDQEGNRLAIGYSTADSGMTTVPFGVAIWSRKDGTVAHFNNTADGLRWGHGDTLLIRRYWGGSLLSTATGKTARGAFHGLETSPDLRYFVASRGSWEPTKVFESSSQSERLACCWRAIRDALSTGSPTQGRAWFPSSIEYASKGGVIKLPSPQSVIIGAIEGAFWLPEPRADQLLVLPTRYGGKSRTLVLDIETEVVVAAMEGSALRLTADGKGILFERTDGSPGIWEISDLRLQRSQARATAGKSPRARVTVVTRRLGEIGAGEGTVVGRYSSEVHAGDWLPGFLPDFDLCDRVIHITAVNSGRRVEVSVDAGTFVSCDRPDSPSRAVDGEIAISSKPVRFFTGPKDYFPARTNERIQVTYEVTINVGR